LSSLLEDVASAIAGPLAELRAALAQIEQLGGAARLAGDPLELRRAASAWRQQAGAVRRLESELDGQVQRTRADSWQGEASQAFAGNWRSLSAKLAELAAGYDRMAAGLEQAAARAAGFNSLAAELVAEIEVLQAALHGLQEVAAAAGLAARAGGLVSRLEELLRQVEAAWAEFLSWALVMELWFQHLLQTMPRVQPVAVPRPDWEIGARLGPGGPVIELRASTGGDAGGATAARLRRGPPADAGSLWRWLLVLLAATAGHDAGLLARLIARATGDGDPENQSSKNPADGEPAFPFPPNLGPPEEPPKNEKGEIDWAAWEARLRQKGITGDVAERIAVAEDKRTGAFEELTAAERLADAGYAVRFVKPVENAGHTNPDIEIVAQAGRQRRLWVEVKSGRLNQSAVKSNLEHANAQIKYARGSTDSAKVAQQRGWVLYDATRATTSEVDQAALEAFMKRSMTTARFRQIRFYEVLWRDGKVLKRTFMFRHPDGSVDGPVTEVLSSP
jgi:WXG100 family type VII secretion target